MVAMCLVTVATDVIHLQFDSSRICNCYTSGSSNRISVDILASRLHPAMSSLLHTIESQVRVSGLLRDNFAKGVQRDCVWTSHF